MIAAEDELINKRLIDNHKSKNPILGEAIAKQRIADKNKRSDLMEKRKQVVKEMIKKSPLANEEQIMKMAREAITVFAGKDVGIGDSWKTKAIPPYAPLSEIDVTYTLKGNDKGVVSIDVNSKIDFDEIDPTKKGPKPQMKITGIYQGTLQVDKASGWLIGKKVKTRLSGEVTQQGRTSPMSIISVVTVKPTKSLANP